MTDSNRPIRRTRSRFTIVTNSTVSGAPRLTSASSHREDDDTVNESSQTMRQNPGSSFNLDQLWFSEDSATKGHVSHDEYRKSPAIAFLIFCGSAAKSIEDIKEVSGAIKRLSAGSSYPLHITIAIQHFMNSMFAITMGHLETYQKHLFAGCFDRSFYLKDFKSNSFFDSIKSRGSSNGKIEIPYRHLLAYRSTDQSISPGLIIADTLQGWHDPSEVNKHFKALGFSIDFFTKDDVKFLTLCWQLRHSIVHTAATVTMSDAEKHTELRPYAGKNIVFNNTFLFKFAQRMHDIIPVSTRRMKDAFEKRIKDDFLDGVQAKDLEQFFCENPVSPNASTYGSEEILKWCRDRSLYS
jgi:hypothetical protein